MGAWIDSGLGFTYATFYPLTAIVSGGDVYACTRPSVLWRSVGGTAPFTSVASNATGNTEIVYEFGGQIYSFAYSNRRLHRWDGVSAWALVATAAAAGSSTRAFATMSGNLYLGYNTRIYQWTGAALNIVATPSGVSGNFYTAITYSVDGYMYINDGSGNLFKWDGVTCTGVATLSGSGGASVLCEYNNLIYICDNGGRLHVWDGISAWTLIAVSYPYNASAINSLYVMNGRLYALIVLGAGGGTLISWATGESAWRLEAAPFVDGLGTYNATYPVFNVNGSLSTMGTTGSTTKLLTYVPSSSVPTSLGFLPTFVPGL